MGCGWSAWEGAITLCEFLLPLAPFFFPSDRGLMIWCGSCRCGYQFCFVCGNDRIACRGHSWDPSNMRYHPLPSPEPSRSPPRPSSPVIARTPRPPALGTAAEPSTPASEGGQDLNSSQSLGSAYWRRVLRKRNAVPTPVQEPLYFGSLRSQLTQSVSNNHRTIRRMPSLRERDE